MSALKSKIQKQVQSAIKKVADLGITLTYVQVAPGTYVPSLDQTADVEVSTLNVPAVKVRMTEEERATWPVNKNVEKILIAALDLPGVTPKLTDYVLIDGDRWEVKKLTPPPGESLHILFVQEP